MVDFARSLREVYRNFSQYIVITVGFPCWVEDFCNIVADGIFSSSTHTEASDSKPGCPVFVMEVDDLLKYSVSCGYYWRHLCYSLYILNFDLQINFVFN